MFGPKPSIDFKWLVDQGALIVDVRSEQEFKNGHVKNAVNIPLPLLQQQMNKIPVDKPVITCCASGMRSGVARKMLLKAGYQKVFNGGNWKILFQYI